MGVAFEAGWWAGSGADGADGTVSGDAAAGHGSEEGGAGARGVGVVLGFAGAWLVGTVPELCVALEPLFTSWYDLSSILSIRTFGRMYEGIRHRARPL